MRLGTPGAGHRWQANPTASADTQVRRAANFDVLVRNVYKVLLTRGLVGCVIDSTDPGVREVGQGCHRPSVGCRGC